MIIYHNPRCSKSRQTLELIEKNNKEVEVVKYLDDPISKAQLKEALSLLGMEAQQIIRKGEAIYKEQFKGKTLSNDEWIDAMIEHPKLMERPIVVHGKKAVLGRPPENVLDLF